ncbi:MAG TPA: 2-oxoglutarate and iron-dependent oxygenase domain-containing protein [Stellaceae bacterium]|jgi:isopenicillin N synthase-like dioxygenase|nr:2-oxoglutarate and iron-dependent oxygenase domain-containing protein [Stellaceae bacterium]
MAAKITLAMLASAGTDEFPVIDLAGYLAGASGALDDVARQLRAALEEIGFLIVVNHGIGADLLDGVVERTRRFHALPFAEKTALGVDRGNGNGFTGYLASGGYSVRTSKVNDNTRPDLNAAFFMDRERPADDPDVLAGKLFREPNKWPTGLPGFRDFLLRYWDALEAFSRRLLPAFAAALDLPPDYFDRAFEDAQCVLRLSHFPAVGYAENQFGLAPHTDANFFTVLPQANVEGLYIRPRGRGWIKAPRVTGSLIINSGDMCRRWTNDRFLSTEHLAVNLSGQDRYSTPFFYTPHIDHPIVCLPTCCDAANPAKYLPITYGEYRVWWLDNNYRTRLEEA